MLAASKVDLGSYTAGTDSRNGYRARGANECQTWSLAVNWTKKCQKNVNLCEAFAMRLAQVSGVERAGMEGVTRVINAGVLKVPEVSGGAWLLVVFGKAAPREAW